MPIQTNTVASFLSALKGPQNFDCKYIALIKWSSFLVFKSRTFKMSGHCYCINGNQIWCISCRHSVRQRIPIQDIFWWPKSCKPAWKRWIWLSLRSFLGTQVKQMLEMKLSSPTIHYGSEQPDVPAPNNSLSHELESEWASEQTNECSWVRGRSEQNEAANECIYSNEWCKWTS